MASPALLAPQVAFPLGGFAFSSVRAANATMMLRAVKWYRDLQRLGVHLPMFLVHDVGMLYAAPKEQLAIESRVPDLIRRLPQGETIFNAYTAVILELSKGEASNKARSLRLSDDLIVVVLARLLANVAKRVRVPVPRVGPLPFDAELFREFDGAIAEMFAAVPRHFDLATLEVVEKSKLHLLTIADAMDLDTLRLLGMLGPESSAAGALAHVDLLAATSSPAANDIVNFSLELLPRILETSRTKATGTHAIFGYSGLGTKGSVDSLVLSELSWDSDEFARRMVENELLYYTREQSPDEAKRLHYIVIDAAASMRGEREVFARGLAIALAKKLQLQGEDVWIRFFDSRLYDVQRVKNGVLPAAYLLAFKGERGRNPARVFTQLATELELLRLRDARDPVVHLITHAALHVPRGLVAEVCRFAHVFGVFILPSGGDLELEYLDLLESHVVVDHKTLTQQNERNAAANNIVDQAAKIQPKPALDQGRVLQSEEAMPVSLRSPATSVPPPSLR
jgi:hypothetical protein